MMKSLQRFLLVIAILAGLLLPASRVDAFIHLRGSAIANTGSSNTTIVNVPSGLATGDLWTATFFYASTGVSFTSVPSGWTLVASDTAGSFSELVYSTIAPASPVAVNFVVASAGLGEGVSWGEFDDGGNALSIDSTGHGNATNSTFTVTTAATTAQNWEAFHYTIRQGASARVMVPSLMTTVDEGLVRTSSTNPTSVGYLIQRTSGTTNSQVVTSTASGTAPWVGWSVKGASAPIRDYRIRNFSTCFITVGITATCNKPTGTLDGDLVVMAAGCTDVPSATFNVPTGGPAWTAIVGGSDTTQFPIGSWQHIAATDPTTYQLTTSVNCRTNVTVWSLFDNGTGSALSVKGASAANSTAITAYNLPSLLPKATDDILLFNLQGSIGNAGVWDSYGYVGEANTQFATYMMSSARALTASTSSQGPAGVAQFSGTTQSTESVLIDIGSNATSGGWFF